MRGSKDFNDPEFLKLIENCCNSCEVCMKYKHIPLCPVVTMLIADKFNQVVSGY